jgi:hydroxypyruvate reductase
MSFKARKEHLSAIFQAGIRRVDPYQMLLNHVGLEGTHLTIDLGGRVTDIDLKPYNRIMIIGMGKATAPMARAMETILGDRLTGGVISVKYGHTDNLQRVRIIEAGHPVPDQNGMAAAAEMLELASHSDAQTLVISLISGGGSALLPLPARWRVDGEERAVSLDDKQKTTELLLACGADIEEINCVRKHLSMIKGGRLLSHLVPARSLNFILSDVVGDNLSSIASGTTCADPTTFQDAVAILKTYGIDKEVPESVQKLFDDGLCGKVPETLKADDPALELTTNILIGTNLQALDAAVVEAEKRGYQVIRLTSRVVGEAREVAKCLAAIALDCSGAEVIARPPVCIMSGGEPVVQLKGDGKGGRNQEMALAFLLEMGRNCDLCRNMTFLAASTDGNDGPTDAAGAFADLALLEAAADTGTDPVAYLERNDSYHFFQQIDGLLKTGPTNTNVCDLHMSLIDRSG